MIKDYRVLIKFNEIWGKIKGLLSIRLHSEPIYDDEYIKPKVRSFNGEIHATFWGGKLPKEGIHFTSIAVIAIDLITRID